MNPIRLILQITLPLLIIVVGFFGMKILGGQKPEVESSVPEIPAPLVSVIEVAPSQVALNVRAQGTVVPKTEAKLVAEVSGRLIAVSPNLVNGGFVQAGEMLIKIDARDYELAVAQAQLSVAQAVRRLEEERADAAVAREEWDSMGKGDPSPLTLHEPQVAEAEASLDAARASLERAQLDLERTEVASPFAARVRKKMVDVGEFVSRGQTLATGYGIEFAEVRLPLPDTELAFLDLPLSYASESQSGPRVTLWANYAGKRYSWVGRIVRTEGEIDPRTRMIVAVAQIADPYGEDLTAQGATQRDGELQVPLAVGMFVQAEIEGRTFDDVILLPRSAMRNANTVYTVDAESRLHMREVIVARTGRTEVVITGGSLANERIVTSPIEIITEGMLVQVIGDRVEVIDEELKDDPVAPDEQPADSEGTAVDKPASESQSSKTTGKQASSL